MNRYMFSLLILIFSVAAYNIYDAYDRNSVVAVM